MNNLRAPAAALVLAAPIIFLSVLAPNLAGGSEKPPPQGPGGVIQYVPGSIQGDPGKFDAGFYEKVQGLILAEPGRSAESRAFSPDEDLEYVVVADADGEGDGYHHAIIIVAGDGRDAIDRNKASLVDYLNGVGARDIYAAVALSFVTAEVPVGQIPPLSLRPEVLALGDGELPIVPHLDEVRGLIGAAPADLAGFSGGMLNGSGVTVGVMDDGINSVYLNDKVAARMYCPDGSCRFVNGTIVGNHTLHPLALAELNQGTATHGTVVAHVIATSGLSAHNGIAPGVALLDANMKLTYGGKFAALDWTVDQGADVTNLSATAGDFPPCTPNMTSALLYNEAVNSGVVVVTSAGNSGYVIATSSYRYNGIENCGGNYISVGGLNGFFPGALWARSTKGPVSDDFPRLSPHLVAPASNVQVLETSTTNELGRGAGTSVAAPMVSAAAALLLQLKPDLNPAETKSLLFLGADWTGPVPCSSSQYERYDPNDYCSYGGKQLGSLGQPFYVSAETLKPLNHVGFGVLNVAGSLSYVQNFSSHVVSGEISRETPPLTYGLNVTGYTNETAKVLLTWLVERVIPGEIADLDLAVSCPGPDPPVDAGSTYQTTEFAVFQPPANGTCAIQVAGSGVNGTSKEFALAATHPLVAAPSHMDVWGITVDSASGNGTYLAGERVQITVAFPRAVNVSGNSPPHLSLDTDPPGGRADYTGTDPDGRVLTFEYLVRANQTATNLDYMGTDALVLPADDSITDALTGTPLRIILQAPGGPGSLGHSRDIAIDGMRERPAVVSAWTVHATRIDVSFSKPVDSDGTDGSGWTVSGPDAGNPPPRVTSNTDPAGSWPNMTLTLSGGLRAGASNLTLSYERPSTGGIADTAGNHLADTSIPVEDRISPAITSIARADPAHRTTNQMALAFQVAFSEPVGNVDRSDFELSGDGSGYVAGVSGSGASYLVDVAASGSGTIGLDVSSSHDIADPAGNHLSDAAPQLDQDYLVDLDPPAVLSIARSDPIQQTTNHRTLSFNVTFSEPVGNVDRSAFALSEGLGSVTGVSGSGDGSTYLVTVRADSSGAFDLDIFADGDIADPTGNHLAGPDPAGPDQTYLVDLERPTVTSISRHDPAARDTSQLTLIFRVTFGEPVENVDTADFRLAGVSGTVDQVDGSGATRDVTVTASAEGTVGLDVSPSHDISDPAGNRLAGITPTDDDQAYAVDITAPDILSIARHDPDRRDTSQTALTFRVTFSEPVEHVDTADFALSGNGSGTITGMAGSGATRDVTVTASSEGTFNLDVSPGHDIRDPAGNYLAGTVPTGPDQTYAVDTTLPSVTSIVRHDPDRRTTPQATLVYRVTFSEPVQNVDRSDFTLSSGTGTVSAVNGTGATWDVTATARSSGPFDLDVSSNNNIQDAGGQPLSNTDPPVTDQDYLVDLDPPTVSSISRHDPAHRTTSHHTLTFGITFSEPVINVDQHDFGLSGDGAGTITGVVGSGDGSSYLVTVAPSSSGAIALGISPSNDIADIVGRPLSGSGPAARQDRSYLVDLDPPYVTGITRSDPASQVTSKTTLVFRVAFSEPVTGVDRHDFAVSGNGTGTVPGVGGSGSVWRVTVSALSDGAYNLDILSGHGIADIAGNPLPHPAPPSGPDHSYVVDTTAPPPPSAPPGPVPPSFGGLPFFLPSFLPFPAGPPPDGTAPTVLSISGADPPGDATNRRTLTFNVTFSEPVTGVNRTDFAVSADGGPETFHRAASPALEISHRQTVQDAIAVERRGTADSVTVGLNITHPITSDLAVLLAAPDGTARTLHNGTFVPGGGLSGTYRPDFDGTGIYGNWTLVIADGHPGWDGTLDSWSLTINHSAPEWLLEESAPALVVAGPGATRDTITVGQSGIAESVAVAVNITHASADDLRVELVPPDGPVLALHGRTVGPANNLVGTYAPDLAGVDIAGNWTLRVLDGAGGGNGTLNSWSLAINYSSAGLVTALDGSGPSYLATVIVAQDGAYGLGIVPDSGIADAAGNPLDATAPPSAHTYLVDTVPPAVLSIEAADPTAPAGRPRTVIFNITFSEPVVHVDRHDFVVWPPGAGAVSGLAGSGPSYLVAAAISGNGTSYRLDVVPDVHGITDIAGNRLDAAPPAASSHRAETVPRTRPPAAPPARPVRPARPEAERGAGRMTCPPAAICDGAARGRPETARGGRGMP